MNKDIQSLDSLIRSYNKQYVLLATTLITVLIACFQALVSPEFAMVLLYLIPVAITAWYHSRRAAWVLASAGCFSQLLIHTVFSGQIYQTVIAPYWNIGSEWLLLLASAYGLDWARQHFQREQQLEQTDDLTGVMNLHGFNEYSQKLLKLAARHGRPTIIAYIDLCHFHKMNEQFGYSAGDRALKTLGHHFSHSMRKTDVVARLHAGQFAIILPETDVIGARTKLGKLHNELERKAKKHNWPIGFNMGVMSFDTPPPDINEAFQAANSLMQRLKQRSDNDIVFERFQSLQTQTEVVAPLMH